VLCLCPPPGFWAVWWYSAIQSLIRRSRDTANMTVWIDPSAASKHNVNKFTAWTIIFAPVQGSRGASPPSFSPCDKLLCCRSIHVHQPKNKVWESTSCLLSEQSDFHILRYLLHIYAKLRVQPCYFIRHLAKLSVVQVGCPACSNISRLLLSNLSPQPSHEPVSSLEQSPLLGTKRQCHPILPHHCQQRVFLGLIKRLDWA